MCHLSAEHRLLGTSCPSVQLTLSRWLGGRGLVACFLVFIFCLVSWQRGSQLPLKNVVTDTGVSWAPTCVRGVGLPRGPLTAQLMARGKTVSDQSLSTSRRKATMEDLGENTTVLSTLRSLNNFISQRVEGGSGLDIPTSAPGSLQMQYQQSMQTLVTGSESQFIRLIEDITQTAWECEHQDCVGKLC
ncbi:uncharacterized protein LOC141579878 isoform X1 [Saimiri boliviensis]|uniref:uncharacterized protein LOC141579878 isoform X1 n=1 Tax=Saimiri boliviensis TaxID=27679 RepID=UPI003D776BA8